MTFFLPAGHLWRLPKKVRNALTFDKSEDRQAIFSLVFCERSG